MKVFLIAAAVIFLAVFGMCFNIIIRKDGRFPDYEVSSNEEMRKLGIRCMKEQDDELWGSRGTRKDICDREYTEACKSCGLYKKETI